MKYIKHSMWGQAKSNNNFRVVCVHQSLSEQIGVPQGSILGPFPLMVYTLPFDRQLSAANYGDLSHTSVFATFLYSSPLDEQQRSIWSLLPTLNVGSHDKTNDRINQSINQSFTVMELLSCLTRCSSCSRSSRSSALHLMSFCFSSSFAAQTRGEYP